MKDIMNIRHLPTNSSQTTPARGTVSRVDRRERASGGNSARTVPRRFARDSRPRRHGHPQTLAKDQREPYPASSEHTTHQHTHTHTHMHTHTHTERERERERSERETRERRAEKSENARMCEPMKDIDKSKHRLIPWITQIQVQCS